MNEALLRAAGELWEAVSQDQAGLLGPGELRLRVLDVLIGLPDGTWGEGEGQVGMAAAIAYALEESAKEPFLADPGPPRQPS